MFFKEIYVEKIYVKDLYSGDDILILLNEEFKNVMKTAVEKKEKVIVSFELLSLTRFFLSDFKKFINQYPHIYKYVEFQKVNKHYKKDIFLNE